MELEQLIKDHTDDLEEIAAANQDLGQRLIDSQVAVAIFDSSNHHIWRAIIGQNKAAATTSIEGQLYMHWTKDKKILSIEVTDPDTLGFKHRFMDLMNNLDRLSALPQANIERRTYLADSIQADLMNLISPANLYPNQAA